MKKWCIQCADQKGLIPFQENPDWVEGFCWECGRANMYVLEEKDYEDERQGRFTSQLFYPEVSEQL